MKGTVVFDFDYTLADTTRFKEALASSPEAVTRMSEFMFEGAESVLRRLKEDGWKLALLTLGEPVWQQRKAIHSGLLEYFDYVVCTAEPKATRLAEFLAWPPPLVFVNDNGEEIDVMRRVLPQCRMIAMRGPKPLPTSADVVVCGDLEEVYRNVVSG